jgi:hypothetical protein
MSDAPSAVGYLTQKISELIRLGPVHACTWVSHSDPGRWMQVSVHDGEEHYLTALCVLPPDVTLRQMDRLLGKSGRKQAQIDRGMCLVYYLAQCADSAALLEQAPRAAEQCAAMAKLLWGASEPEHFVLLGARGPKLAIQGPYPPLTRGGLEALPEPHAGTKGSVREAATRDDAPGSPSDQPDP